MADPVRGDLNRAPLAGFEAFYEASIRKVVGRVFLMVGDAHLAEELAQDAMVKMMEQWVDRCDQTLESNTAWTVGIAANLARRHWRRLAVAGTILDRLAGRPQPAVSSVDLETIARVDTYRWFATLPRRQREVATLSILCEMTAEDIANVLGISASAVRTHMQRIRGRLIADGMADPRPEMRDEQS